MRELRRGMGPDAGQALASVMRNLVEARSRIVQVRRELRRMRVG